MRKINKQYFVNLLIGCTLFLAFSCTQDFDSLPAGIALKNADGLQVGVAVVDITPEKPTKVEMEGYADLRKSTGVHDSLTARCLIINDGESIVAFISLDLLGVFKFNLEDIKWKIAKGTGLKERNIFFHSIHTHSGPEMLRNFLYNGAYMKKLNHDINHCVLEAFSNSKKATALISTGNSQVKTINRRYPKKKITNKFTTIEFQDSTQHTIAMLLNFGCHPVVLGPDNKQISADYVYYLRKKVEAEKGGIALFFNSRFGDINPPPINTTFVYERTGGTFKMAQDLGEQLAKDMLLACLNNYPLSISLRTATKTIKEKMKYTNHTQISILDLGQSQIAMIPGEPIEGFVDKIEALLPGPYPIIFGLTNDEIEYIIPENEWNSCTKNSYTSTCYEETTCSGSSVAGKLEDGYKDLIEELY
jgi:hypothetical protein